MYLHIEFTDGSNPFFQLYKRGGARLETRADVRQALRRWQKRFIVSGYWTEDGYNATATERNPLPALF